MAKVIFALLALALAVVAWRFYPSLRARVPDDFQKLSGSDREASARAAREAVIKEKYRIAGVAYPGEIFIRWFKREAQLELWARDHAGPFHLVATYPILKSSGRPGPKRREGDQQVPEGFYEIDRFNPESLFHLSLRLNYPNAADRILSDRERPGSDIYIHGKNASIGCGPIGDQAIEEVYLAALDASGAGQKRIAVHIFPARMQGAEWERWSAEHPAHTAFWAQLQPIYDAFERTKSVPEFTVSADGRYVPGTR
jgi:murein L,D-transpeptidase YafK